jgi:hypothetical protein
LDTLQFDDGTKAFPGEGSKVISRLRLYLILPALCAIAYPSLLWLLSEFASLLHVSTPLRGVAIGISVIVALAAASGVMLVSFELGLVLSRPDSVSPDHHRARILAHLAFAAPSILVGFGNVAGVLDARAAVPIVWPIFWTLLAAAVLFAPKTSGSFTAMSPAARHRLGMAHGISACVIIILFIAPHIGNHLTGFRNGATHIAIMKAVRQLYRSEIVEPVLLTLIGFQILSGVALVRGRMRQRSDFFGTLQTMTGVYVGIYFLAHMTAVFSARHGGTDTDWNWLTSDGRGMLTRLSSISLVAHYWMGPIAIFIHIACGLRMVMLQNAVSPLLAGRVARALIGLGVVASSVILVALLGVHFA